MITKQLYQNQLDAAPDRWRKQYYDRGEWTYGGLDKENIYKELCALEKPLKAEDIDHIIGNSSWTRFLCDCCNEQVSIRYYFKPYHYDEYDNTGMCLCETCIKTALPDHFPEFSI